MLVNTVAAEPAASSCKQVGLGYQNLANLRSKHPNPSSLSVPNPHHPSNADQDVSIQHKKCSSVRLVVLFLNQGKESNRYQNQPGSTAL